MPDQTLPTTTDTAELTGYAATAAELRRIADALDTLPPVENPPYVSLSILPEHTAEAVDAVALAVLGKAGALERIGGDCRHIARSADDVTSFHISIHATVPGPPDERDAELERLRAEVAALKSADYGHDRIDHGDAATPVPATVDGHPEFTGRATVGVVVCALCGFEPDDPNHPKDCSGHPDYPSRATVPEMQTRPQCSPECMDEVMADGKSHPDAGWHHDSCPNAFRPGVVDPDGGER